MATFRFFGPREIEIETQACIARVGYYADSRGPESYILFRLFDKLLFEFFTVNVYDERDSWVKLEELMNNGVGEENAEFLRLIQSFRSVKSSAKYFKMYVTNQLMLEELKRRVRGRKDNYMRYMITKYSKVVEQRFRTVCDIVLEGDPFEVVRVLHGEAGGTRLALFVEKGKAPPRLLYVMVVNDSDVALYRGDYLAKWTMIELTAPQSWGRSEPDEYIAYEVFKYIVDGDLEGERLLRGGLPEADFRSLLGLLNGLEEEGRTLIRDSELYGYIKSVTTMNVIVEH